MDEQESLKNLIDDEVLRARVRRQIDPPQAESKLKALTSNPVLLALLTFLCTGVAGAFVANYYNEKLKLLELDSTAKQKQIEMDRESHRVDLQYLRDQRDKEGDYQRKLHQQEMDNLRDDHSKDLDHQRTIQRQEIEREGNFAIELNKTRVTKMGDVWGKIYLYEAEFQHAESEFRKETDKKIEDWENKRGTSIERVYYFQMLYAYRVWFGRDSEPANKRRVARHLLRERAKEIFKSSDVRFEELTMIINTNRFWIGEEQYKNISKYIDITREYISNLVRKDDTSDAKKALESSQKLAALEARREKARQDIVEVRKRLVKE